MLNRILIDPQAFTAQADSLNGTVKLQDLDERAWSPDIADLSSELRYTLTGGTDRWQRPFLDLSLSGSLKLHCQRCMQDTDFALNEQVHIVLFSDENALDDAMLADEELEGMLLDSELDVFSLLEDQMIMALPISPKHDACGDDNLAKINQDKPNPFAVLAGLKKG